MEMTKSFVDRLQALKSGERSRLRRLADRPLDRSLAGFDLFTGLWWPLRRKSPRVPRREASWLVGKLFGAYPLEHRDREDFHLAVMLGRCEPADEKKRERFRRRFDALLQSPLHAIEPHLRWAIRVTATVPADGKSPGLNWVRLLDDLSRWDQPQRYHEQSTVADEWANSYLDAVPSLQRR
jgi:hypothetical protein